MSSFEIKIELSGRWYRVKVERIFETATLEKFVLRAGEREFELHTNRPEAIRKKRKPDWKIVRGEVRSVNLQEAAVAMLRVFNAIERHYRPIEEKNVHQRRKD